MWIKTLDGDLINLDNIEAITYCAKNKEILAEHTVDAATISKRGENIPEGKAKDQLGLIATALLEGKTLIEMIC